MYTLDQYISEACSENCSDTRNECCGKTSGTVNSKHQGSQKPCLQLLLITCIILWIISRKVAGKGLTLCMNSLRSFEKFFQWLPRMSTQYLRPSLFRTMLCAIRKSFLSVLAINTQQEWWHWVHMIDLLRLSFLNRLHLFTMLFPLLWKFWKG